MKTSLFYLPGVGTRAQVEEGHAGLRGELYDDMLREVLAQCQLADELGIDSVSFTEHHFHVEGFEVSNNPVLLDLYIGLQTKRLRVGQLGIVLPASNPIRVAEDIAMLDRMTGGPTPASHAATSGAGSTSWPSRPTASTAPAPVSTTSSTRPTGPRSRSATRS